MYMIAYTLICDETGSKMLMDNMKTRFHKVR